MTQPQKRQHSPSREDLLLDDEGITTTEYLILMILVVIAGFASFALYGDAVEKKFEPTHNVPTAPVVETAIV